MAAYIFRDSLSKPLFRSDLPRPIDALKLYQQDRWGSLSIIGEAGIESVKEGFNPSEFEIFHNRAQMLREQDFIIYEREGIASIPAWVAWAAAALSVATSIYSIVQANKMKTPSNLNRTQESATNRIQARTNDARVDQRVENNYGQVRNFFTQMSQPYIRCEENQQAEYSYMSGGKGRLLFADVRDGRTLGNRLQQWSMQAYRPFESPNNAQPYYSIGSTFTRPVFTTFIGDDLTRDELDPPNELEVFMTSIFSESGGVGVISTTTNIDLRDYFSADQEITLDGLFPAKLDGGTVWLSKDGQDNGWLTFDRRNLGPDVYTIISVNERSMNIELSPSQLPLWSGMSDFELLQPLWRLQQGEFVGNDGNNPKGTWSYRDKPGLATPTVEVSTKTTISGTFDGTIGPFEVEKSCTQIQYNLYSDALLYDKGKNETANLTVNGIATVRETNQQGALTGQSTQYQWSLSSNSVNRRKQACNSFDIQKPYQYCTIEFKRTSNRDFEYQGNVRDIVEITELYFHRNDNFPHFGDKTTIQLRRTQTTYGVGKASKVSALTISELNINGIWTATRYFDDIICDAAADPVFGRRSADAVAEMRTNLRAARDQLIDYFGRDDVAYFDYCVDSENTTFESFVRQVASAVFCTAYLKQNLRFAPDVYQPIDTAIFGHGNKLIADESLKYSFDDLQGKKYDCVEVKWRNPDNMDAQEVIYIPNQGSNPKTIDLSGVRNERNATIHGWREWYRITSQRYSYECTVGLEGTQLIPNQRIGIVNNCCGESFDGSFVAWDGGVNVRFSQKADLSAGGYRIVIQSPNGGVGVFGVTQGVDLYHGVLSEIPTFTINTNLKENLTVYRIAKEDDLITESYALSEPELTDKGIKLKAVNYAPIIYSKDLTI